jgi:hypothetical protein
MTGLGLLLCKQDVKLYAEGLRKSDQRRQRWVRAASFDVLKVLGSELGVFGQPFLR